MRVRHRGISELFVTNGGMELFALESGKGLPQSKTLTRAPGAQDLRQVLDCASPLALSGDRQMLKPFRDARHSKPSSDLAWT